MVAKAEKPKGITCPECGGAVAITHRKLPCPGLRVRYLRCTDPACEYRFVTDERVRKTPSRRTAKNQGE